MSMLKNLAAEPETIHTLARVMEFYAANNWTDIPDDDFDGFILSVSRVVCALNATYNDDMIQYIVQSELYRYEQAHAKTQTPVILQLTEIDEDGETVDTHRIVFRPGELNSSSCRRLSTYINNTHDHKIRVSVEED